MTPSKTKDTEQLFLSFRKQENFFSFLFLLPVTKRDGPHDVVTIFYLRDHQARGCCRAGG